MQWFGCSINELNVDDFEVVEDVKLCLCNLEDEEEGKCDYKDEQTLINMHRNTTIKEFKYQPEGL